MAKLYFRTAAMGAGKSLALLQVEYNYFDQNRNVLLFTSQADNRYGEGRITSRMGPSKEAETFDKNYDFEESLRSRVGQFAAILLDEAQFLTKAQVQQLHRIAALWDVPVMAYGIRSDSKGEPFEGSMHLLTLAESIEELKTICICGKKATMNMRVDGAGEMVLDGEQVVIGGDNCYRSVCSYCFYTTKNLRLKGREKLAA